MANKKNTTKFYTVAGFSRMGGCITAVEIPVFGKADIEVQ